MTITLTITFDLVIFDKSFLILAIIIFCVDLKSLYEFKYNFSDFDSTVFSELAGILISNGNKMGWWLFDKKLNS